MRGMNTLVPTSHAAASVRRRGLLLASLGAVAFSGKAIIVKFAYRYGVDAVTLIMYRMLFALPMFLILTWWAGRAGHTGSRILRLLPGEFSRLRGTALHQRQSGAAHSLPESHPGARARG